MLFTLCIKQCNIGISCGSVPFCVEFKDYRETLELARGRMILLLMYDGFTVKNISNASGN